MCFLIFNHVVIRYPNWMVATSKNHQICSFLDLDHLTHSHLWVLVSLGMGQTGDTNRATWSHKWLVILRTIMYHPFFGDQFDP